MSVGLAAACYVGAMALLLSAYLYCVARNAVENPPDDHYFDLR